MSWYAIDVLGSSFEDTKNILFPFKLTTWIKIAVIVFFIGGGSGGSSFPTSTPSSPNTGTGGEMGFQDGINGIVESIGLDILVIIVGVIALLGIIFVFLSSVFQFVFFQSLKDEEILIIPNFKKHLSNGAKYFVFNIAMISVILVPIAGIVYMFINGRFGAGISLIFVLIPLAILTWLVTFFVKSLALPEVIYKDAGFIEALKTSYGYVKSDWKQAVVYLLVMIGVSIVISFIVAIALILAILILGIPLVIIGVALYFVSEWLLVIPIVLGILGLLVAWFGVAVPVNTYFHKWVLNVYEEFASIERQIDEDNEEAQLGLG